MVFRDQVVMRSGWRFDWLENQSPNKHGEVRHVHAFTQKQALPGCERSMEGLDRAVSIAMPRTQRNALAHIETSRSSFPQIFHAIDILRVF